jgi:(1->4)-alpha-D-glucan 1-alpha-D-glucosylmutase
LVIEKILADDEMCPAAWPVHGDTGYRWASDACALFVDPRHEADFGRIQAQFTGESDGFDTIAHDAKRQIIETALATDLEWLVDRAWQLSRNDLRARDFGRAMLREAITELAAGMRVYRTYLDGGEPSREDRTRLQVAAQAAQQRLVPSMAPALQWVIERLLDARDGMALAFVRRFQQFTAPVMAKAVEDTALYRYHRLLCLNDVGSDPRRFGIDAATFHTRNAHRAKCHPHAMLASSTHDSKRSEDVRLRLAVLSEMPQDWHATVLRWRTWIGDTSVSASDVYLLMQTLVGVWPSHGEVPDDALWQRVCDYMAKAVREGKRRTSWTDPDASYEEAMATLVQFLSGTPGFVNDVARFVEPLAVVGALNSLAMLACKLTAPGVPDVYQGCEAPCFSLVDPDNRRLPPFERLASALSSRPASPADMLRDGRAKQWVTQRLLQWRAREPALWRRGCYDALPAHGANAGHVVAFARGGRCVTVVGRLLWQLCAGAPSVLLDGACWSDTAIDMPPGNQWQDVITSRLLTTDASGRLSLRQALQAWPVAVLSPAA